ncbi:TraR/DksA C4-type zinc finger protein [Bacillaceae bacterium Marseille-Q3522]|nr:TraR/DksA C4-type zinc finger protein [Bacillaceae bacterium Marseille-Q3522]
MLTTKQLNQLKSELLIMKHELDGLGKGENDLNTTNSRESVGELSIYDNHPADMATELYEREKDFALEGHFYSELNKINLSLKAINDGTYGICKVCKKAIPYERLLVLPTTLYCKEHSPEQDLAGDRPVEEEVLRMAYGNQFKHLQFTELEDEEDSFQEVARYGTSETPSDFKGDYKDYGSLYNQDDETEGFAEEYETFVASDISGNSHEIYRSKKHEQYEDLLDQEGIEAPFGDVPLGGTNDYSEDEEE